MKVTKRFVLLLTALLMLVLLAGCGAQTSGSTESSTVAVKTGATTYPVTIQDDIGDVTIESKPQKIVSLAPSTTEELFAVGAGARVVGDTEYCNYPQAAKAIEKVGSYSTPNVEKILALSPDLVVSSDNIDDGVRTQLENAGVKILVFGADTVTGVEQDLVALGEAVDNNDDAAKTVKTMQDELSTLQDQLSGVTTEKTVFIDLGSYYTVGPGSLIDNELTDIKAKNIAADTGKPYPVLTTEEIVQKNPDVYISLYTPVEELKKVPGFDQMTAFKTGQVYSYAEISNNADMISRPGPRTVEGMKVLAHDIYPDIVK